MTTCRRRLARRLAFAVAAATLLGSHAASAQPAAPSALAQKDAAEHKKRAFEAVKRLDAETARLEFLQAYALVPSQKTLWNLLVAEADSNHPLDALKHLRAYLADPRADPKKSERAKGLLAELTAQVGHLQITAPENVPLTLDGFALTSEQRAGGIDVVPGKHVVEANIGDSLQRREVDVAAGEPTAVFFEAPPEDVPADVPAAAPVLANPVPVAKDQPPPPARESSPRISAPPMATWILGGVAVAALGTGIGLSLAAKSKRSEIDDNAKGCAIPSSAECARLDALGDEGRRDSTLAWIAYGGAGAAMLAGGLIWYFKPKEKSTRRATSIVPLAFPGMTGVQYRTSF